MRLLVKMLMDAGGGTSRGGLREAFVRDKREKEEQRLIYETKLNFSLAQNPIRNIFHEIENFHFMARRKFSIIDKVFFRGEQDFVLKVFDILALIHQ